MNLPPIRKKISDYFELIFVGFCMGMADIIPGVSGGTIAFIMGIYEELIQAIKSFDLQFLKRICSGRWKNAFDNVAWRFMCFLLLGIVAAILTFSKVISWLLINHPILLHSFFFGLIFATVPIIAHIIKKWTVSKGILIFISAVISFFLVAMVPVQTPEHLWFIFLCGAIAISAMILPGISGAFILVLLGKYQYILTAVNDRNFLVIAVLLAGIVVGIVTFVRVLSWLLERHHDTTVAVLTGIVLGSLNKIWPWKQTLQTITLKGKVIPIEQVNILPPSFDFNLLWAVCLMVLGFFIALLLNKSHRKMEL